MWKRNGLSLVLATLTLLFLGGQMATGLRVHNEELLQHGRPALDLWHYLASGHFISATFENWESEFLQMGMYVLLTVSLRQRGSAESRPLDPAQEQPRVDAGPAPWPVRRGGRYRTLYGHSLAIAFGMCSRSALPCTCWAAGAPKATSSDYKGWHPPACWNIWPAVHSGSNRCRTGRVSSWQCWRWWY